jgi:formylglycine-generating enzyme required for sulfatase activity
MVYVSAKGFCIDAFEFTIEQYVEFLNMYAPNNECPAGYKCLTPGKTSNIKKEGDSWVLIDSSRAKHPVVMVTLHGAEKACEAQGKKLCSSEEWESACKGEKGFIYPYGDVYEKGRCNNAGLGKKWSVPVGSLERCEGGYKGLFDMSGNVAEWTTEEVQGSKGEYYARGGSWFEGSPFPVTGTFCAARFAHWHESGMHFIGFRCCKDI